MKVGTYTRLSAPLLGWALLWTSAACGSRTSLLQPEDAGVTTEDDSVQASNTSSGGGGRAGSSASARAGRGGSAAAGAGGAAGRAASARAGRSGGRAGQSGQSGQSDEDESRAGAGGRSTPRDRDAAADSGEDEPTAGSGGEPSAGTGGAQAGAGDEAAGAGGESGAAGADAADSGMPSTPDAGPADAGSSDPGAPRLTALTPEQTTEICGRIESATANLSWNEAVRGWCSRGSLGTPECSASQEACVAGASIIPMCAQSVPDCPEITIEEFVTCRTDALVSFVEYNRMITCDTPTDIPAEAEVPSCVGPYQRCPPLAALRR